MQRRIFVALAAAAPCAFAQSRGPQAARDLNGRWDITIPGESRRRAWWLEVLNTESGAPKGSFIGAPGGDLNQITDAKVTDGEITWSFNSWRKGEGPDAPRRRGVYKARVVKGKLEGTLVVEGDPEIKWIGARAPKFKAVDVSKLKEGKPVELFNGKDLSGWQPTRASGPVLWKVEGGILKNSPGTTDIMTEARFWNFKLHAEFKYGAHSNSGIGLRGRYEIQINDDYGKPVSTHGQAALYSRLPPAKNASKPPGEWQTYDITIVENRLWVVFNGQKVLDNVEIEGLTAMAIDPNEGEPGPIAIQGDHGPVEFRKLTLTPLA